MLKSRGFTRRRYLGALLHTRESDVRKDAEVGEMNRTTVWGLIVLLLGTTMSGMVSGMAEPTVDFSNVPTDPAHWVLIAAALHDEINYESDPDYVEAMALHDYFVSKGFDEDHIILLVDFDDDNPIVDGPATKGNIFASLDFLAQVATDDSFVFIGILDWGHEGSTGYYVELNDEPLYDYELGIKLETISYDKMVVNLVFRYSGGFIDEVSGNMRLITCSNKNNIDVDTHYKLSEGLTHPLADFDGNGKISFEEAFLYEKLKVWLIWRDPRPVKDDEIPGQTYTPEA